MVDPSLALTEEGIALFEDEEISRQLTVSRAFAELLDDRERWGELAAFGVVPDERLIFRLRELLEPRWVEKFSYTEIERLSEESAAIRDRLLQDGEPLGDVAADQWVFLVSRSWLLDRTKRFLERLRRAGARVLEVTTQQMGRLVEFVGSNAQRIANLAKAAGKGIEIAIEAAGPVIAALLTQAGVNVDAATLDRIGRGVGLIVEFDP
jgi:hypothetical protein